MQSDLIIIDSLRISRIDGGLWKSMADKKCLGDAVCLYFFKTGSTRSSSARFFSDPPVLHFTRASNTYQITLCRKILFEVNSVHPTKGCVPLRAIERTLGRVHAFSPSWQKQCSIIRATSSTSQKTCAILGRVFNEECDRPEAVMFMRKLCPWQDRVTRARHPKGTRLEDSVLCYIANMT